MHCPKHNKLSLYLDLSMTDQERDRFALHLQNCPICQHQLEALKGLKQDLRDLPSPVLGFDLAARLQDKIRNETVPRRPARSFWVGWGATGLTTAASLACGVWLGALLTDATVASTSPLTVARVFDPVPPGGLCAAAELCRLSKGIQ
ncbi:MAG: zf-HC2 domain-containing protein [Undibacterium sp.]|uniref:anti-sigma factor family protein n=1 Tax=Undibacterium sp. TaxID=1914977 RepID=UPI00271DB862|nr:zf-HC2 domain-containing protein [Undibacterium sp.]MDO8650916.1 zf-HC2 domain-containing protein [Undibacterium sp.]